MKMFKKSLIAASVAVAATAAYAGSIDDTAAPLALEGAVAAGTVGINGGDSPNANIKSDITVELTVGADYIENDVLEFYISGAELALVTGIDPSVSVDAGTSGESAGAANFIDADTETGKVRFRVETEITSDQVVTLQNVAIDSSNFSDGSEVNVRSQAVSLNSAIGSYDAVSNTVVAEVERQFAAKFTESFDQIIDVNESRELFAGSDTTGSADNTTTPTTDFDTVEVELTDNGGGYAITEDKVTHTVTAEDFSYAMAFDKDEDGELSSAELCGDDKTSLVNVGATNFTCSIDGNVLSIQQPTGNITGTTTTALKFNAPGADSGFAMKAQSFEASVVASNSTVSATAVADADAGSWELNGASVYVPYMPYASGLSQIVYVTNNGSQAGSIEVTAFDDSGNDYGPYDLGEASANSITKITGSLEDALTADGFTQGKLAFTVIVTAPENNIEVYTGYNAGNDRGLVINSSNK